jgi:hypothetical protein
MLRRVALVRTDVSEELSASIIHRSVRRLLVTADVVPSSPIFVSSMMETISSTETSVLTRATRRNIREDSILHSHRRENLKSDRQVPVQQCEDSGEQTADSPANFTDLPVCASD